MDMTQGTPVDNPDAAVGDDRTPPRVARMRLCVRSGRSDRLLHPIDAARTRRGAARADEKPR
jgi:hypothetical protein